MSYAWENNLARSWETLEEDEHGVLRAVENDKKRLEGLRQQGGSSSSSSSSAVAASIEDGGDLNNSTLCRNMIRYLVIVVDLSKAMGETDLRPSRRVVTSEFLRQFVISFFDENPLSNMKLLKSQDGRSEKLSEMSASPNRHLEALRTLGKEHGEFSLQNSLEQAFLSLQTVPQHGSKEVLVILASLSTCDEGDVFETIDKMNQNNIRCSVIGLSAEVYIAKYLARETLGKHGVCQNKEHFRKLLQEHVPPAPVLTENRNGMRTTFIRMGFPSQAVQEASNSKDNVGGAVRPRISVASDIDDITSQGYICPRCETIVTELPTACPICGLELITSAHLSRSYHHLFPVPRFAVVTLTQIMETKNGGPCTCSACEVNFAASLQMDTYFQCPKCRSFICEMCEQFIHETLHNCPKCLMEAEKKI